MYTTPVTTPRMLAALAAVLCIVGLAQAQMGQAPMAPAGGLVGSAVQGFQNLNANGPGMLYYGVNGPAAQAWAPGSTSFKCVRNPIRRINPMNSGGFANTCSGTYALDFRNYLAMHPSALGNPLYVGEVFNAQLWFRDPPAPAGSNLSNALQFTMAP